MPRPRGPLMEQISEKEKVCWGWGQALHSLHLPWTVLNILQSQNTSIRRI